MALWADRSFLRDVQYRTDANLAARQSIYAYQQPPADLVGDVLDLITAALTSLGLGAVPLVSDRFGMDQGEIELRRVFASVTRHDFAGRLVVPGPEPVAAYVRSMSVTAHVPDPDAVVRAVTSRLPPGEPFHDTVDSGCLICA